MSDEDIIDTIAEEVWHGMWEEAKKHPLVGDDRFLADEIAKAAIAALRSAGYAVTKLPEPDSSGDYWFGSNFMFVDDDGLIMTKYGHTYGDGDDCRDFAAALLAAADAAEAEQ